MLARKALAGTAGAPKEYVEDVFSTYLYTGNGSTQTITNNIDLSTEGGMVWTKGRSVGENHGVSDTVRGANATVTNNNGALLTNGTSSGSTANHVTAFNSNGFTLGTSVFGNDSGTTYASWTFRKAEKFFDVVTYTGNGANRTISHNLGSVPGCIIVKRTDTTGAWQVYHRANTAAPETDYLVLNTTAATADSDTRWNDTLPTSTEFSLGTDATVNANSGTYVAYLFAHDAGGFGDAGDQSVIKCGSFTTDSPGDATVTLDWEPQFVMIKASSTTGNWRMFDNMRGFTAAATSNPTESLLANTSGAETSTSGSFRLSSTGFSVVGQDASATYIYIAIRRGPMKTPEAGTEVFYPKVHAGTSSYSVGFPTDLCLAADQSGNALNTVAVYRLAGNNAYFGGTASSAAEVSVSVCQFDLQNSFQLSYNNNNQARWHFRRAPGFFDVVCYTGTGSNTTISHNLGVVPEMMIVKWRSGGGLSTASWAVYHKDLGNDAALYLNSTIAKLSPYSTFWNNTTPTSTVFSIGTEPSTNYASGANYVAYLFASVSGVSKVGSYTGNGSSQTINCGFTAGARFVLIKRTDSTGDWVVFDSARGIVSGNDPYLLLNSTAAEVTDKDAVDTDNTGFVVNETTGPNVNTNSATYIYLAIA